MSAVNTTTTQDEIIDFLKCANPPTTLEEAKNKKYHFWETQPVMQLNQKTVESEGPITELVKNTTETTLPQAYSWSEHDLTKDNTKLLKFLNKYYFEDPNSRFIEVFTEGWLKWMFNTDSRILCLTAANKSGNQIIIGVVGGSKQRYQIRTNQVDTMTADLICIHPRKRFQRLTPCLIKEFTRRGVLEGCTAGFFKTNRYIPKPFTTATVFHRPLDIATLVANDYTKMTGAVKMEDLEIRYKLPKKTVNKNIVRLTHQNQELINAAYKVYLKHVDRFSFHRLLSRSEFEAKFVVNSNDNDTVHTYVLCNDKQKVQDMVSFQLGSMRGMMKNRNSENNDKSVNVATLLMYTSTNETAYRMISDGLILARNAGCHLMNATNTMDMEDIFSQLHFGAGPTRQHWNLYNYALRDMEPGFVSHV